MFTPYFIRTVLYAFIGSILGLMPLSAHSSKVARINSHNDHGVWLEESLNKKLAEDWSLYLQAEQRWASNSRLFYYHAYDSILQYSLKKEIIRLFGISSESVFKDASIGMGPSFVSEIRKSTQEKTKWIWIFRPILEFRINFEWRKWQINHRLRGEYHEYLASHYKKHALGRYRLAIYAPLKITSLQITPYVSNEWFFRVNSYHKTHPQGIVGGLYEIRFRIGLTASLFKDQVKPSLFWQWRPHKQKPGTHPRWFNTYQLGIGLNFNF